MNGKRRSTDVSADEHRLFPNFSKSAADEIRIVPGQSIRKAAKSAVQGYSPLRPLNTLSWRGKESGPVCASGKPRISRDTPITYFSRKPKLGSPTRVDEDDRQVKRQRRESSPVKDLVDLLDDYGDDQKSTVQSSVSKRDSFLASGNSVHEFRSVEKLMKVPNPRKIRDSNQKAGDAHSDQVWLRTSSRVSRSPNSSSARKADADKSEPAGPGNSTSTPVALRVSSESPESPDELQGDVTVRPMPRSFVAAKKDDDSESAVSSHFRTNVRGGRQKSPSDIKPTIFGSEATISEGASRRQNKPASKPERRLFPVSYFRNGETSTDSSNPTSVGITFDGDRNAFSLPTDNSTNADSGSWLPVRKIALALRGIDESCKVRLRLSKTEGSSDQDVDIEFHSKEDQSSICKLLETKGVKLVEKASAWMDKIFAHAKNTPQRPRKRPSSDAMSPRPSDRTGGCVKRQKLSDALQGSDEEEASKQAPRRLPASGKETSRRGSAGFEISVKKFYAPVQRETRSQARRRMVDLVEDDADIASDSKPPTPKRAVSRGWTKPLVYPPQGKRKAEVDSYDLERLADGEFLNDNLIAFYLRFLEDHLERNKPDVAKRVYFFNSYFYATLTNTAKGKRGINYEGVQKWTRNVDLFDRDYIIVPINECAHWYVAIICNLSILKKKKTGSAEAEQDSGSENAEEELPVTPTQKDKSGETSGTERARESFASLTLTDTVPDSQEPNESAEEWPEKEENPTLPTAAIPRSREASPKPDNQAPGPKKKKKHKRKSYVLATDQPTIITFDSLGAPRPSAIKALRAYLLEEAQSKQSLELDPKDIKGMTAKEIPLQPNFSDCGLYLLAYMEKFAQDPENFVARLLQKETETDKDWPMLKSGLLRRRLRKFLFNLKEEQEKQEKSDQEQDRLLVDAVPVSYLLGPPERKEEEGAQAESKIGPDRAASKSPAADPVTATVPDTQQGQDQGEPEPEHHHETGNQPQSRRRELSDDQWLDKIHELVETTGSEPKHIVEVQVPGTPPLGSQRSVIPDTPQDSPQKRPLPVQEDDEK